MTSAVLRAFNEIVVQNIINVAGKIALVTGLLATVLRGLAAATYGSHRAAAAILATISSIATYVALIAAAVKALVSAVRFTLDGLSLLLNQDAKVSNFMRARAEQTGMETMTDVVQAGTQRRRDPDQRGHQGPRLHQHVRPHQDHRHECQRPHPGGGHERRRACQDGRRDGGQHRHDRGGPLVTGTVLPGMGGADERYSLYTAHPDDMGMRGAHEGGGGILPPSEQKNRIAPLSSRPAGSRRPSIRPCRPGCRKAMEDQNKLRDQSWPGPRPRRSGEVEGVNSKVGDLAGKLGIGKDESQKLKTQVADAKATQQGKE